MMTYSDKFKKFIEIWQKDFAIERSIDEKVCLDKNNRPIPWYTYPAIEYLLQFDYSQKSVFEYGTGYSSLFWAERAKYVLSIEDNKEWFAKWQKEFSADNLEICQRDEGVLYSQAILERGEKYDIIVIDGKMRAECAANAVKALNNGGIIILDDSDRVNTSIEYQEAISTLQKHNLLQVDFFGFCPMNNYTKTTSLFFCRDFAFCPREGLQPLNGIGNLWQRKRKERKAFYKENVL